MKNHQKTQTNNTILTTLPTGMTGEPGVISIGKNYYFIVMFLKAT